MKLHPPLVHVWFALLFTFLVAQGAWGQMAASDSLRLDELRIKGTHNSYHRRPLIPLHPAHRYEHDSLFVQLEYHGVRALELDLHLSRKGYEVYHIRFVDGRTHCRAFVDCLKQIRTWSDLDRNHEPLMIWLEAKDFAGGKRMKSLRPVDDVLRNVLGDRLLTPDDVRGRHPSLRAALTNDGWPTLAESRGKIVFMLTASVEQSAEYTSGHSHLRGRVMFVESKPSQYDESWAAVTKIWRSDEDLIRSAKEQGLLISTTTCTAEQGELACATNRRRAIAAGVNIFLDDYVRPTPGRAHHLDLGREVVAAITHGSPEEPVSAAR